MKFIILNEGTDKKIDSNFSSMIGKYLLFYRNGYFIGKLVEAFELFDYHNCKFMFQDVHHLKGKFLTLDEFTNTSFKETDSQTYNTWIVPEEKEWKEVTKQRITSEGETVAIKIISEIYYHESLESILFSKP